MIQKGHHEGVLSLLCNRVKHNYFWELLHGVHSVVVFDAIIQKIRLRYNKDSTTLLYHSFAKRKRILQKMRILFYRTY